MLRHVNKIKCLANMWHITNLLNLLNPGPVVSSGIWKAERDYDKLNIIYSETTLKTWRKMWLDIDRIYQVIQLRSSYMFWLSDFLFTLDLSRLLIKVVSGICIKWMLLKYACNIQYQDKGCLNVTQLFVSFSTGFVIKCVLMLLILLK